MLHGILGHAQLSDIIQIYELITKLDLITDFDLVTKFREVSIKHCNGCDLPTVDTYSSGHLVLSNVGLAFVPNVETIFS